MNIDNNMHSTPPFEQPKLYTVEETEKIVEVLNSLVQINNDRIEGYANAADETEDTDLKLLFNRMLAESKGLKMTLINEVRKYGGEPTESTSTLGKVFRAWMDFKATITGNDRKAILSSCEFGEDAAQEKYADAIKESDHLPAYLVQLFTEQKLELHDDINDVKSLRERE